MTPHSERGVITAIHHITTQDGSVFRFKLSNGLILWIDMAPELVPKLGDWALATWRGDGYIVVLWPLGTTGRRANVLFREDYFCVYLGEKGAA